MWMVFSCMTNKKTLPARLCGETISHLAAVRVYIKSFPSAKVDHVAKAHSALLGRRVKDFFERILTQPIPRGELWSQLWQPVSAQSCLPVPIIKLVLPVPEEPA